MKIAFIYDLIYPYTLGGAEKRFWELARRLSLKGHQVYIIGMKFWQGSPHLVKDSVYIHGVNLPSKIYLKTGVRDLMQILKFSWGVLVFLLKEDFDIIDCNAFPYLHFFFIKLISMYKRIPLVITWQEVWGNYWYRYLGRLGGLAGRLCEKMIIFSSDNIIVHAPKVKNSLTRIGGNNKNISIIADGVDLKFIESVTPSFYHSDLIFAGRLLKHKNVDILIKAVSFVKNEFKDIRCIIIGKGKEKENLIKRVEELNLKDNIIFKENLRYEELISYMKASKIFVFPSTREGFGIVVIEAMTCGLPVIIADDPLNASTDLIKNGENGFICRLEEKEFSCRIIELLSNKNLREIMAKKAKDSVVGFDWDRITEENEIFYHRALKFIN